MRSQARYIIAHSEALGNEPVVKALSALEKYEIAVGGDSRVGGYGAGQAARQGSPFKLHLADGREVTKEEEIINHQVGCIPTSAYIAAAIAATFSNRVSKLLGLAHGQAPCAAQATSPFHGGLCVVLKKAA